jgi:predicted amino acid dehydrogenase
MDIKSHSEQCLGKFAFLIHPTSTADLYESGPPEFRTLDGAQRENWEQWIGSWSRRHYNPGIAYHLPAIRSKTGGYAEGWLIAIPLTPEQMLRLKPHDRDELMGRCIEMATDLDVDMLGLGAFTSIITRAGTDLVGCGINVTTGSSLTAMIAAESLKLVACVHGRDLSRSRMGIVGAAGSVGRLACMQLGATVTDLTLFGNPDNATSIRKLAAVAGELYRPALEDIRQGESQSGIGSVLVPVIDDVTTVVRDVTVNPSVEAYRGLYDHVNQLLLDKRIQPPIILTVDLERYLPEMQFVLSATSQGRSFIDAQLLAPGAIVCDAARPPDVQTSVRATRPDVFVYEGGLVRLPEHISFGRRNVIGCQAGVNLACLSETIVLTMSRIRQDYSLGAAPPLDQARRVFALAQEHGFSVHLPGFERRDGSIASA